MGTAGHNSLPLVLIHAGHNTLGPLWQVSHCVVVAIPGLDAAHELVNNRPVYLGSSQRLTGIQGVQSFAYIKGAVQNLCAFSWWPMHISRVLPAVLPAYKTYSTCVPKHLVAQLHNWDSGVRTKLDETWFQGLLSK